MPVERRGWVTHGVCWVNGRPEELSCLAGRRQPSLSGTSRMRRESHVRICERLGVKFPGPTRRTETGTVILQNDALLEFKSGQITTVDGELWLDGANSRVADAGKTGSNSALTGLINISGNFWLWNG